MMQGQGGECCGGHRGCKCCSPTIPSASFFQGLSFGTAACNHYPISPYSGAVAAGIEASAQNSRGTSLSVLCCRWSWELL